MIILNCIISSANTNKALAASEPSYAMFSHVTDDMNVGAICVDSEPTDNNDAIAKEHQPVIASVTILEAVDWESQNKNI